MLVARNWSNGLPLNPPVGTVATDGSFDDGNAVADWLFSLTAGTITAADGFNLNRGGTWNLSGGSIIARYVLANEAGTAINISGGTVALADVEGAQHMGAANGGIWNVSGSSELDGTHATLEVRTGGPLNIASDWSGSWIRGIYSGPEWQDLFLAGLITYDNTILDLDGFKANFTVSEDGTTLTRFGGGPEITKIVRNPNGTVTLTWDSRPGGDTTYTVVYNSDLSIASSLWPDEDDSISTGGTSTTCTTSRTFGDAQMFFVVIQN